MVKVGIVIADLLAKAGYDATSEEFKDILAIQAEAPDTLKEAVDKLMDETAAKSNPKLKNHFLENYAVGQNRSLAEKMRESGFEQDVIDKVISENKTITDRYTAWIDLVKEKISDGKKPSKEDKELIEKLNGEIVSLRKAKDEEVSNLKKSYEMERLQEKVVNKMLQKKWSKSFGDEIKEDLAKIAINKELEKIGAALTLNGKEVKVVRKDNFEQDFFDSSNKKVTFDSLLDEVFVSNKFGALSPDTPTEITPTAIPPQATPQRFTSTKVQDAFAKAKADQGIV